MLHYRTEVVKKWKTASTFTLEVKEYNLLNQIVEERTEDSEGNILLKYKYIYNKAGLLEEVIGYPQNQESILKKYEYDGFGRLAFIRDAFNQVTKTIYDDAFVNEWGQKVLKRTEIDPIGNQKEEIFDSAGHLAKLIRKNKKGQILAESEFFYDAVGNELLERDAVIFSEERLRTYETEQAYGLNNLLKTIAYAAESPYESTTSFGYNSYSDLSTKHNPGAKTPITYEYHINGKLESISSQERSPEKISYKLSYDKKGNITEVYSRLIHTVTHEFDPNDQLIAEEIQDEFGFYRVDYTLDGEGLIQFIQLPDGSFIEYSYVGPFVKEVTRLTKDKKKIYNHRITARDLMGNVLEEILIGRAGARSQKWDQAGRRIKISTDFFQDKIPDGGYNPLHNILKREVVTEEKKYSLDYEYDDLSHLISEKGIGEHRYSFDSLGNRLSSGESVYKVNDLNQVFEAGRASYTFDVNGALASKTVEGKTWIFQHNALGQLVLVEDPN